MNTNTTDPNARIEWNVRSYAEGRASGIPEGMARVLAELARGVSLRCIVEECLRTTPRLVEELELRDVQLIGTELRASKPKVSWYEAGTTEIEVSRPAPLPAIEGNVAAATVVGQLDAEAQRRVVAQLYEVLRQAPPARPSTPNGLAMRVTVSAAGELGWWADAKGYRYVARHKGGYPYPPIPDQWLAIWREYSGRPDLKPDSAVINLYDGDDDPKVSLGWHADASEQDRTLPIVTISLGVPASWAVRDTEGAPVSRCRLESGAITLLAGPTRGLEHTIERLLEPEHQLGLEVLPPARFFQPQPSPLAPGKRRRVSITMRVAGSPHAARAAAAEPPPPREPGIPYEEQAVLAAAAAEQLRKGGRRSA